MSDALTDTSLRDVEVCLYLNSSWSLREQCGHWNRAEKRIDHNSQMDLRIPEYIIDDKSYITIYETESSAQLAMATSAFSQTDVEAAVLVCILPVSLDDALIHVQHWIILGMHPISQSKLWTNDKQQ